MDEIHLGLVRYKQVYFVTFNYDTMIEAALKERLNIAFSYINDYTALDSYKLFKLHGSVNWVREIDAVFTDLQKQNDSTRLAAPPAHRAEVSGEQRDRLVSACTQAIAEWSGIYGAPDILVRALADQLSIDAAEAEALVLADRARRK